MGRAADVTRLPGGAAVRLSGLRIGFVFQPIHLPPSLTALGNVELPLLYGRVSRAVRRQRAREALRRVGLADLAGRYPAQMSGGQPQRVAVARAVAPGPELLLADAPTGALDRRSGAAVLAVFQALHTELGLTAVIVTHDPYVARHAQRAVRLEDGRIVHDAPVTDRLAGGEGSGEAATGVAASGREGVADDHVAAAATPGGTGEATDA